MSKELWWDEIHQWRVDGTGPWWDGYPDRSDGRTYETRVTYRPLDTLMSEIHELRQHVERLSLRLEVDSEHGYDGILCRDETIRLLEKETMRLRSKNE
jgi:hypothetical protein